jgi:phage I-like protein
VVAASKQLNTVSDAAKRANVDLCAFAPTANIQVLKSVGVAHL